jgi:protocatechuate 3,4-dioxygenase beta subunit
VAKTDKDGRYRLEGVGRGSHRVSALGAGYGSADVKALAGSTNADLFLHPGAVLMGVVKGPDGKPVAGAVVHAACRGFGCPISPGVQSDAQGRFEIVGVEPGTYQVLARHPQYAPSFVSDVPARLGSTPPVEIRLDSGYRVIGRLAGVDNRAARGQVVLQSTDGTEVPALINQQTRGKAGANGRFELRGLPPGTHSLAVFPIGYPPMSVEVAVGGKDSLVDIGDVALETGMLIRGKVRDASGAPIAGAAIDNVAAPARSMRLSAESEPDGTFVLSATEKVVYHLRVQAEGYAQRSNIDVEPGGAPIDVVLQRAGKIVGTVVDESGRPLPDCRAVARPAERQGGELVLPNLTDVVSTGGRFEITGVRAGTFVVQIQAADHIDKSVSDVRVTAGATTDVGKVVLSAGGVVQGLVTDSGSAPVAGARVTVQKARTTMYGGGPQNQEATTDGAGRFEIRGLPLGTAQLKAEHRRYAPSAPVEVSVDPAAGPAEARITLVQGGTLQGSARRRDGKPVSGAMVHMISSVSGFGAAMGAAVREDGSFLIEHVTPGKADVALLTGAAGRYNSVLSKEVDIRDGETTTIELTLMDVFVSGRVTRGGRPVANHLVRFEGGMQMTMGFGSGLGVSPRPSGPPRLEATSGADGRYELLVPAAGKYNVRVEPRGRERGGTPRIPEVTVPDAEAFLHDIPLPDWALTGVVVEKESTQPVNDAMVEARPAGGEPGGSVMTTIADGRFQLAVDPGSYRVRVVAPKFVAYETTMTLGGGNKEQAFELVRGGTLKGQVRTGGGQGVEGARVYALSSAGAGVRWALTGMDGSFAVEGLASGSYLLFAGHDSGFALQSGVSLAESPADLTLSPGAKVRLVFKDDSGAPLARSDVRVDLLRMAGTTVGIEGKGAYGFNRRTDADGALEIRLPIAAVDVVAWATERKLRGEGQINVQPQMPDATVVLKPR